MSGIVEAFNCGPDFVPLPGDPQMGIPEIVKLWIQPKLFGGAGKPTNDQLRRSKMRKRLDLYEDRMLPHLQHAIKDLWQSKEVRERRLSAARYCKYQNIVKRIAKQVGTVYSEKTKRKGGTNRDTKAIELVAMESRIDEELREANRLVIIVNNVLLVLRTDADGHPIIETVTPDAFTVVCHPYDPRQVVAVIIDKFPQKPKVSSSDPHHVVFASDYKFRLDKSGNLIEGSIEENALGFIPCVLVSKRKPRSTVLDSDSGEDIVDAHINTGLNNVMMLAGLKTGTRSPYSVGDMTEATRGQVLDEGTLLEFEEGVTVGVLELSGEPQAYLDANAAISAQIAAAYDMSSEVFSMDAAASSGFDRQLKRIGLDESRREQIMVFRSVERETWTKFAGILAAEGAPQYRFSVDGLRIDFGEVQTPRAPLDDLRYRKEARSLLLRTVEDDLADFNPDLRASDLRGELMRILQQRGIEIELHRRLNAPRDPSDPGTTPQENGAKSQVEPQGDNDGTAPDNAESEAA